MQRHHRVKCDYGMGDYYKHYISTCENPVSRKLYGDIITDYNEEIKKLIILENLIYTFPGTNFSLVLKKDKRKPKIVDGKLINNIPINWKKTNELWERDAEAKEKKLLVRHNNSHTSGYVFRVYFKKFGARIKYRSVYKFNVNRAFKRDITKYINDPDVTVDAFLLYKNKYNV